VTENETTRRADQLVHEALAASEREHVNPADLREVRDAFIDLERAHAAWLAEPDQETARGLAEVCIAAKHRLFIAINRLTISEKVEALFSRVML
jgi:hypothetical protein